jgi:hypothetical protein
MHACTVGWCVFGQTQSLGQSFGINLATDRKSMLAGPYLKPHLQSLFFWFRGKSDALWILDQGLSIGCLNYRVPTKSRECHSWTFLNIEVSSEIRIVLDSLLAWPNLSTSSNYHGCIVAHQPMLKVFNTYYHTHLPFWTPLYSFLNISSWLPGSYYMMTKVKNMIDPLQVQNELQKY